MEFVLFFYFIIDVIAVVWICMEASEKEGASGFMAFFFSFFFTPIAGLLYLSLFPKTLYVQGGTEKGINNVNSPSGITNSTPVSAKVTSKPQQKKSFDIGDIVTNVETSEKIMIASINNDGTYKCIDPVSHHLVGNYSNDQII